MNVDLIFKIAAVGILVAVLNLLLSNSKREEQALMTTIAGLVVVLIIIVQEINELFDMIKNLFGFLAMTILIKIAAVAVAGTVLSLVIKKNSPEMSLMLTISLAMIALYLAFDTIKGVTDFIASLAETAQISPAVLTIVFKTIGISIITKLSADVCRDAGQSSIASGVELAGAFSALYISLPLFKTVMSMIEALV